MKTCLPYLAALYLGFSALGHLSLQAQNAEVNFWKLNKKESLEIHKVQFSPDGKMIASLHNENFANLWEATSGEPIGTLGGHRNKVSDVAFGHDSKRLSTSSWDHTMRVFALETMDRIRLNAMHYGAVSAIAFNHDSRLIATGSWDTRVRIFDLVNGKMTAMLIGHLNFVTSVAFSPDGRILASAGNDGRILLWNIDYNGDQIEIDKQNGPYVYLENAGGMLSKIAFSRDGRYLASANEAGLVKIYRLSDGELLYSYPDAFEPTGNLYFNFGGQLYYVEDDDRPRMVWKSFWDPAGYESAIASKPGLTAKLKPRNQFETDGEHIMRMREGSELLGPLIIDQQLEEEQRRRARISASTKTVTLLPSDLAFETYDVRLGMFPVSLKGTAATIEIDRDNARTLFENKDVLRIEAVERLSADLETTEILNAQVIHPITGYRYPVGLQVELEEVAMGASLPAKLSIEDFQFTDTDGDNRLSAGERALVALTVSNSGEGPAQFVRIVGDSDADIAGLSAALGTIAPGASKSLSLAITGGDDLEDGNAEIKLSALEINGFHADPIVIIVPTSPVKAPVLSIADVGVQDNQGRATITPGTVMDITVRIKNGGEGQASGVQARIAPGEGVFLAGVPNPRLTVLDVGTMGSGSFKDLTFQAFANSEAEGFKVEVELIEASGRFGNLAQDLGLTLYKTQRSTQELIVAAHELEDGQTQQAGALSSDIARNIPVADEVNTNAVAVIIGNRSYQAGVPQVAFAHNDALLTRRYLEQSLGYRPGNVLYLEDATLTNMKVLFGDRNLPKGRLNDLVKPGESDVFIYFSGHGAPDPNAQKAYLMPVDGDPTRLALTGYSLEVLYENLSKLEARSITVVIDACFSGATGGGDMLIAQASPIGIRVNDPSAVLGERAVVITASGGQQIASWYPEMRHGLLTYFFLKGLQGAADLDENGEISVAEMNTWLNDDGDGLPYMARRLHSREQSPQVWGDANQIIR